MDNQILSVKYKSPIVRFGGKFLLANWIVSKIPQHTLYVEPFAGAVHVLFAKPESKCEILNDLDGDLINFFRVLKNSQSRQKLIEQLSYTLYSREHWTKIKSKYRTSYENQRKSRKRDIIAEQLKLTPELSDNQLSKMLGASDKTITSVRRQLESTSEIPKFNKTIGADGKARSRQRSESKSSITRAAEWFFLNRSSFGGDMLTGGFSQPSVSRNTAMSFRNAVDSLNDVSERLRNVTIECLDYTACVQRYDSKDTLIFADPPYLRSEHYYGEGNFTHEDHYTLADLLHGVKGMVMITHYQNDLYDELYSDWRRHEYQSFKSSYKSDGEEKPKTVEVLYTNFEPEIKTRNLFQGMN